MGGVEEIDADIAGKIQDNMLSFENLGDSDNRSIQTLMRNVEPDMLMIALKGATEPVKDKFFGNMSTRAAAMFQDEMEAKGMLRMTDVDEAQKAIMRIAKKLQTKENWLAGAEMTTFKSQSTKVTKEFISKKESQSEINQIPISHKII